MLYHLNQVSAGIIEDRNHDIAHVCGGSQKSYLVSKKSVVFLLNILDRKGCVWNFVPN